MCVYIYICLSIYQFICFVVSIHVCMYICVYICIDRPIYVPGRFHCVSSTHSVCIYICLSIYQFICFVVSIHVCVYKYIYICVYICTNRRIYVYSLVSVPISQALACSFVKSQERSGSSPVPLQPLYLEVIRSKWPSLEIRSIL